MRTLGIDLETYSSIDLLESGVYAYTAAADFEILLCAYAFDDEPVQLIDRAQVEPWPEDFLRALNDPEITKAAYNANFERTCLARALGRPMPPEQWQCTAVWASILGLPGNLGGVAVALELPVDKRKFATGKQLINYFSMPCTPTKINHNRTRNRPMNAPDKWLTFCAYCKQDVEVERELRRQLARYPIPEKEQKLWELDQRINDGGVLADPQLIRNAINGDTTHRERLEAEAISLTGLENPQSVAQLKTWLGEEAGVEVQSLNKQTVPELIKATDSSMVKRVLQLRQELAKTSVKKYQAAQRALGADNRIRGLLQFYGAGRTGRWAGRLVQVQNLPQNHLEDLALARQLVMDNDFEALELLFGNVPDTLSQLIRTMFIPSPGGRFIVADFSAIEARIIAWLAGEQWRMDVFNSHGKIYEASASQMFKVPIETITKGNPLRQKGKIAELALGYGGGKGALITMGALRMGLNEAELPGIVSAWRDANPAIVKLWADLDIAAKVAVKNRTTRTAPQGITFDCTDGTLFMLLPSGRRLAYLKPLLEDDGAGHRRLTYAGVDDQKRWGRLDTYGGKLTENCVQAIARDCLAVAMLRLDSCKYRIAFHVHDEVILDTPHCQGSLEAVKDIMGTPIAWAPGLPLKADAYECGFYKKD